MTNVEQSPTSPVSGPEAGAPGSRVTVCAIIVTHNRPQEVRRCIQVAKAQTYPILDILVIDNASDAELGHALQSEFPDLRFIRLHRNFGWPFGKNVGAMNCRADWVLFLDDDLYMLPNALEKLVEAFNGRPEVYLVTGQTLNPKDNSRGGLNSRFDREGRGPGCYTTGIYGGFALCRRDFLPKVGFYPDNSPYGGLDRAIMLAALDRGWFCWYCPAALGYHAVTPHARKKPRNFRHLYCNNIQIAWQYYPLTWAIAATPVVIWGQLQNAVRHRMLWSWLLVTFSLPVIILRTIVHYRRSPVRPATMSLYRYLNKHLVGRESDLPARFRTTPIPISNLADGAKS